jgi:hypothetical protein
MIKNFTITACLLCAMTLAACGGGDDGSAFDAQAQAQSAPVSEQEMLHQRIVTKE